MNKSGRVEIISAFGSKPQKIFREKQYYFYQIPGGRQIQFYTLDRGMSVVTTMSKGDHEASAKLKIRRFWVTLFGGEHFFQEL